MDINELTLQEQELLCLFRSMNAKGKQLIIEDAYIRAASHTGPEALGNPLYGTLTGPNMGNPPPGRADRQKMVNQSGIYTNCS